MIDETLRGAADFYRLDRAERKTTARRVAVPNRTYEKFRAKYRNDIVACVHDMFNWKEGQGLTPYQDEIISTLFTDHRIAVRGGHGMGKTMLISCVVHAFALTRDIDTDWKIPTTASNWRQLTKYLWPEIHKWAKLIKWDFVGRNPYDIRTELQTLNLKLNTGESFAVASNEPGYIEGAHADSLLYVFDESKMIPAGTFDAAEGAFSGGGSDTASEAFAIAVSTPGERSGRFYDITTHRPGYSDWKTRHVKLAEVVKAGRMSKEWVNKRALQWGKKSAIYMNRVLGEFADADETSLIPLSWVEAAIDRWYEYEGMPPEDAKSTVGCDPARFGDDKTAIAKVTGDVCEWLEYHTKEDTMTTAGRIIAHVGEDYDIPIGIDTNGIGAGVYDRLNEQGYNVVSVMASEATDLTDATELRKFNNVRAAIWWGLRDALDPSGKELLALPDDEDLISDLTAPTYSYTSRGAVIIESKDDIKKRLGRSPDGAEAIAIALYAGAMGIISFNA